MASNLHRQYGEVSSSSTDWEALSPGPLATLVPLQLESPAPRHPRAARASVDRRQLSFLAEASMVLDASLEVTRTLRRVVRLPLPALGDWCALHVVDEHGAPRYRQGAHADTTQEAGTAAFWQLALEADRGMLRRLEQVLCTGKSEVFVASARAARQQFPFDSAFAQLLRLLELRSMLLVPLFHQGRGVGVLALAAATPAYYRMQRIAFAEEYARRAELALGHVLQVARDREATQARTAFVAGITHDIGTPLTTISVNAQLLRRWAANIPLDAQHPEIGRFMATLERINTAAADVTTLTDELFQVAQNEMQAAPTLDLHPTNLLALVEELVAEYQQQTTSHTITLSRASQDEPSVECDAPKLRRAIGNLLGNAIKYSPEGGEIALELALDASGGLDSNPWAVLRVRDQGIGIPPADLAQLFRPYYRAENARGTISGRGLGLVTAHQIVELHGGNITVDSMLGSGTTFTIRLPLTSGESRTSCQR